jgi:hypothetical protein
MFPVIYIPLWFNILLFISGLILISSSFYLLVSKKNCWFLILPLFAYGLHFSSFYAFITFSQLTAHVLDSKTMTLWSAILRFQGIITALSMLIIIYFTWGEKRDGC